MSRNCDHEWSRAGRNAIAEPMESQCKRCGVVQVVALAYHNERGERIACPHGVPLADWCEWCSFETRHREPPLVKGGQGRTAHELVSTSTSMLKLAFWLFVLALVFSVIARLIA